MAEAWQMLRLNASHELISPRFCKRQDTDYTGYEFWLMKLNQFNGNDINAEMVKGVSPRPSIGSVRTCVILRRFDTAGLPARKVKRHHPAFERCLMAPSIPRNELRSRHFRAVDWS